MTSPWRLIADVGGTNVRFGQARDGEALSNTYVVPVAGFATFKAALDAFLASIGGSDGCSAAAIAAAGPVSGPLADTIKVTNNDWVVSPAAIAQSIGRAVPTHILNDLEAVGYALNGLDDAKLDWLDEVRTPSSKAARRRLALNVGTGFGSATLLMSRSGIVCCPAESGHMLLSMAPTHRASDVHAPSHNLPTGFGADTTVEDVLSGNGVQQLVKQLGGSDELAEAPFAASMDAPPASAVRQVFSQCLARAATNLTLATASWDGVYLCGSVASAWYDTADRAEFRNLFTGAGPMAPRLARTPVALITHALPAFIGLANVPIAQE